MIKLLHVITTLDTGGAEATLLKLLQGLDRSRFEPSVVSLAGVGSVGEEIAKLGIPVRGLGMRPGSLDVMAVGRLTGWIRRETPDVVQTWMYHGDLIGGVAAAIGGRPSVVWNIRHTNLDPRSNKRSTIMTARACAILSRWIPQRIVCCSEVSRQAHVRLGYARGKVRVISNGFDTALYRPDPEAGRAVREELGIPVDAPIVGMVARFHPEKDHRNFVQAAGGLALSIPDVHFLLCGKDVTQDNQQLAAWIREAGLEGQCHLLGPRRDVPRLMATLDVATLSSVGEGFPNVIGEAMASGVPCVVTDVGDSAWLVGDTGRIVPARDAQALAQAWKGMLEMGIDERRRLGLRARQRIEDCFSAQDFVRKYEDLYQELAQCVG